MIKLFYAPDNASLIIRIILEELAIDYLPVPVDRRKKQQTSPEYLALNPKGLIPVCIIDDTPLFETAAIAMTLAENATRLGAKSKQKLVPDISDQCRPQFLKWLFFISNTIHPDLRQMFYADQFVGSDDILQDTFRKTVRQRLHHSFTIIDEQYSDCGSDYLFGDTPSIVDIYLALCTRWVQIYPNSARGKINSGDYPSLRRMLEKLQLRDAVVGACGKEGITDNCFSEPEYANPPEGSAL